MSTEAYNTVGEKDKQSIKDLVEDYKMIHSVASKVSYRIKEIVVTIEEFDKDV